MSEKKGYDCLSLPGPPVPPAWSFRFGPKRYTIHVTYYGMEPNQNEAQVIGGPSMSDGEHVMVMASDCDALASELAFERQTTELQREECKTWQRRNSVLVVALRQIASHVPSHDPGDNFECLNTAVMVAQQALRDSESIAPDTEGKQS